jgi:hypothetical protein
VPGFRLALWGMFGWNSLDSRDTIFVLNLPLGGESGSGNQPLLTPNGLGPYKRNLYEPVSMVTYIIDYVK